MIIINTLGSFYKLNNAKQFSPAYLVEPEILICFVGNKIPCPAMSKLMSHYLQSNKLQTQKHQDAGI